MWDSFKKKKSLLWGAGGSGFTVLWTSRTCVSGFCSREDGSTTNELNLAAGSFRIPPVGYPQIRLDATKISRSSNAFETTLIR